MAKSQSATPAWNRLNTHIVLWHGCIEIDAKNIASNRIVLTWSRSSLDFGRGFYTTTDRRRAVDWAFKKYVMLNPNVRANTRPAIIKFLVPLDRLAQLDSLMFVRGDAGHDAYWSFVNHCRLSPASPPRTHLHPGRSTPDDYYDVVSGPIAETWPPMGRMVFADSDQFSFHTAVGVGILNDVIDAGRPGFDIVIL